MKKNSKEKFEKDGDGFFRKLFRPVQDKVYDCQVAIHKRIGNKQSSRIKSKYKKWIFYGCWMALPLLQLLVFYCGKYQFFRTCISTVRYEYEHV